MQPSMIDLSTEYSSRQKSGCEKKSKTGVMLINLGTPDNPTTKDIRRFLNEFLSDPLVIEKSAFIWQPILQSIILPFRPRKLVTKYKKIWMPDGSPLQVYTQRKVSKLQKMFSEHDLNVSVVMSMRYGNPSIQTALDQLRAQGCERILVMPMYPQYSFSTTATIFNEIARVSRLFRDQPEYRFVKRYATEPAYIQALSQKIEQFWEQKGLPERLLLSFHGLPQRCVDDGDPYYDDCLQTTNLLRQALAHTCCKIDFSFQSRFGEEKWILPATQTMLEKYPSQGVKKVDVICPGFAVDCLETLEEIQFECAHAFKQAGGQQFRYIPCLNDDSTWIAQLFSIINKHL